VGTRLNGQSCEFWASDVEFVAAAFSRHARHKQFLYFARNFCLVSSRNLISPHQQPLPNEISQAHDSPQASQTRVFRSTGNMRPICFNSFILLRRLIYFEPLFNQGNQSNVVGAGAIIFAQ